MSLLRELAESDSALDMIKTIAWVIGIISFVVFVALFGRLPLFRKTPIGWLHRLLLVHIPSRIIILDDYLTGRRITRSIARLYRYLMHDRHPVVMVIFILLQSGSEVLFLPPAAPYIHSSLHKYLIIPILVVLPYVSLYLSYSTSGHHITADSYSDALTRYPYDYILYHPHQSCRSCCRPKPARSKHCSICKTCVERHDHHCIWINNCVGFHNYHYFVALLVSIAGLLGYGAWTGIGILDIIMQNTFVPQRITNGSITSKRWSTGLTWGEWLNVYSVAIATNARIGAVTLLACMTFPLALGFLVYHAYLIWAGTTTNETAKWTDLREDVWDKLVWEARIADVKAEYPGPLEEKIVYDPMHFIDATSMKGVKPKWANGREPEWWIIRTKGGMQPTRWQKADDGSDRHIELADERWTRVRDLKEVTNLYDLGVAGNAMDSILRPWNE